MSRMSIDTAMVLAAGFGTRMRPLSEKTPKPLIPLAGKPLMDWVLERLRRAGIQRFVVNAHYLADQIEAKVGGAEDIALSREPEILDTGGGVKKALPLLGDKPFVVCNADTVWLDGPTPAVERMMDGWDPARMDVLLMLHPVVAVSDYDGPGDFHMDPEGRLTRRGEQEQAAFVFAGVSVIDPAFFQDTPDGKFSLNLLFDRAAAAGRLFGIVHDGEWYHVGTPDALRATERVIALGHTKTNTR